MLVSWRHPHRSHPTGPSRGPPPDAADGGAGGVGVAEAVSEASGLPAVVPVHPLYVTPLGIARAAAPRPRGTTAAYRI